MAKHLNFNSNFLKFNFENSHMKNLINLVDFLYFYLNFLFEEIYYFCFHIIITILTYYFHFNMI